MHVITTIGPDNATKAVLPFITAKGAMGNGESVEIALMQEATYLGSEDHADLSALKAPGLPPVDEVLGALRENGALEELLVCGACAEPRGVSESDIREYASWGDAADIAAGAARHDTTVTF